MMDSSDIVTGCTALLGLLYLYLSWRVVSLRRSERVGIGDGENTKLRRAIRVHANFIEYVPFILVLTFLLMRNTGSAAAAAWLTGLLLIARLLHAWGLGATAGVSFGRFAGTALTWVVLLAVSLLNLCFALTS